jgi:hypothetical protein
MFMTPMHHRGQLSRAVARFPISAFLLAAVLIGAAALPRSAQAGEVPTFAVDASWPKPLPNNWIIGQVGGITTDWQGHIWVFQRPRSLTDDEKGAALTPPRSKCCVPAPPVLEFDTDGNLLRSWGAMAVDAKGNVYTGEVDTGKRIQKFKLTSDALR